MDNTKKQEKASEEGNGLPAAPAVAMPQSMPGAFDLFKPSIEIVKRNLAAFIVLMGIPTVLTMIGPDPSFASNSDHNGGILEVLGFLGSLLTLLTFPAVVLLQLKGARSEQISGGEAFSQGLKYLARIIGLAICMAVIFIGATVLLIVPLFFAIRRYALAPYYLIDRNLGVFEALKVSAQESQGMWGAIYGIIGVTLLIALPSAVPVIGWMASAVGAILYAAAPGLRYLHIKALRQNKEDVTTPIEKELHAAGSAA
ncbi:MAG TPA: hypothetical protein VF733_00885 [Candidatus Saccharimonadales bacterium]